MYYKDSSTNSVYFYDSLEFVREGLVPISNEEAILLAAGNEEITAEDNKATAISLLQKTDWVEYPSVNNETETPYLLNATAFNVYRKQLRLIAINPTEGNISWPTPPSAEWKL
jgi:hypothetical protein